MLLPAIVSRLVTLLSLLLGGLSLGPGCRHDEQSVGEFPRAETLYVGGQQWGDPTSFNPFEGQASWPLMGMDGTNLVYETLLVFNPLDGSMQPLLAASYQVFDDRIEVMLQPTARWSDGRPVTGWDIKYTFDIAKQYKSLPHATVWAYLEEVRLPEVAPDAAAVASGHPLHVVFVFKADRKNPLVVLDQLQQTRIVPKHVMEQVFAQANHDVTQFFKFKFDRDPVVSGPYTLHSYSSEKIVAVRRDEYWGNDVFFGGRVAAPKYVVHPIYKSNDHYSVGLQQGRLDISCTFIPRIWLKRKKQVHSWYEDAPFFVPTSIVSLFVNAAKKPLDDRHLRRAMAFAINYKDIRELAVSGYSEPLRPGYVLPFGIESKYFSEEDAAKHGASVYDPERAKAELALGGYRPVWDAHGELVETRDAQGHRVPTLFVKSPTGWTDWESMVRIAVRGMRAAGIDVRERFIDGNLYWNAVFEGDFDLITYLPSPAPTPSKPWSRFEFTLTSHDWAPLGDRMYKNMGRFNDPKGEHYLPRVQALIDSIPTLTDGAQLRTAYRELNRLFMYHQPLLPLVYRPDQFFEFSTKVWQGFPDAQNAFLPPQLPGNRMGTRLLWHLKPAESPP